LIDTASIRMAQNLLAKLDQINERASQRAESQRPRWDEDDRQAHEGAE